MKTIEIRVYSFAELSEDARETAIENVRTRNQEDPFDYLASEAMDTIKKALNAFNCELTDWSIDFENANRSDFRISFGFEYLDEIQDFGPLRLRTWLLNNFYENFYTRKPYGQYKKRDNEKWRYDRYSRILFTETDCPFTGICYDYDFLEPLRKFLKSPDRSDFKELITDGVMGVIRSVEKEIEYRLSDEGIKEDIEVNEMEFTEDGEIY